MKRTFWDKYLSGNEALAQMVTGAIAEPVAGWGGALAMLGSMNPATGARATEKIRGALTYQPRDSFVADRFAQLVAPVVERYEAGKEWMGEGALNATGSPAAATAAYTAPDALMALLGARAGGIKPQMIAKNIKGGPSGFAGSRQVGAILPEYGGAHRPVTVDGGAARLNDLEPAFGPDIYGPKAASFFGTGESALDRKTVSILHAYRGRPDAEVTVYRAVPSSADAAALNAGDWVTVNKAYAKMHGEGALGGDYKIIEQRVRASDLTTNADSFHEQGYYPK